MLQEDNKLLNIKEASEYASKFLSKLVTTSNISYLIQYGRIKKIEANGSIYIDKNDLLSYYNSYNHKRQNSWKKQGDDNLNWALSFDQYKESETTKHVHRLHPYKGKFIPQLVEYFLDNHTDTYKKEVFFHKDDVIIDPFCGSGTTLVQANELGIHAVGIDISEFNSFISNCKLKKYDTLRLYKETLRITHALRLFLTDSHILQFEDSLLKALNEFNNINFPVPDYKYRLRQGMIDETSYGHQKEIEFLPIFNSLIQDYHINLGLNKNCSFLDKWYSQHIRNEIEFVFNEIQRVSDTDTQEILKLILSRTIRSCRATTHADLATLLEPVTTTYYCSKHGKICKPLFSIIKWWVTYTSDTLKRLQQFDKLKTDTYQVCLTGDSRSIDLLKEIAQFNQQFYSLIEKNKIKGIFSSPPYVGLINYHEQHAYAYELFGFERRDELEIGPLYKGQGTRAKASYIEGISDVLNNCKKYLVNDFDIFLVANDKYNLYPIIADKTNMQIVNRYHRPVLNRTEKAKNAYSETIFHMKNI